GFDEASFIASTEKVGFEYVASWHHVIKADLAFLAGDHRAAITMSALAEAKSESTQGTYRMTELCMTRFLSFAAVRLEVAPADEARIDEAMARLLAQMARWAEHCPANFRHKDLLMRAEQARLFGHYDEAMELYDEAIDI